MGNPLSEKKKEKLIDKALMTEMAISKEELSKLKKKLKKVQDSPDRGVETWFRISSKNLHTRLQIVDTKSNLLITTNAIVISVVLGSLYPRLQDDPHMIYAVAGMILTSVISSTFAILATIPKAQEKKKSESTEIDLMSFDDFYNTNIDEYQNAVTNVLESGKTLYPSIIADIHKLGVTLAYKYRLIRISYLVFMIGLIISVIAFAICHIMF